MSIGNVGRKLTGFLSSRWFYGAVMMFFVLQALWIALSAAYPMAFDEEFHLGLIRMFGEGSLTPFATVQPGAADGFGAIIRDPSYLYHLLMSVPYRFFSLFTDNQTAIVILLRLLNIAMFTLAIVLFRRVLLRAKTSPALANTALAVFVLVPIVPQLAAHINYDNLLMPVLAWLCLLVVRILDGLGRRKLDVLALATLVAVCLAASLIKYEALPFVGAAIIFVSVMMLRTFGRSTLKALRDDAVKLPKRPVIFLLAVLVVVTGLVVQRYGVNVWQYQTLKPSCEAALNEPRCEAFGPWARNHLLEQTKGETDSNPIAYSWVWLQSLHYRAFFGVSGPTNNYVNYPPVPLPAAAAVAIAISGLTALVLYWRRVFVGHTFLVFLAGMSALYLGALWLENYSQFLETGEPVAINGRYLIPILLPLAAVFGRALSIALSAKKAIKPFVASAAILLFLQGGGVFTFILRSDNAWYWPNNAVQEINYHAQRVLRPVFIEGDKFY